MKKKKQTTEQRLRKQIGELRLDWDVAELELYKLQREYDQLKNEVEHFRKMLRHFINA